MKKLFLLLSLILIIGCNNPLDRKSFDNFADATKPFMGYGLVNNWDDQDARSYMNLVIDGNVQCMAFEFFDGSPASFASVDKLLTKFQDYVDLAKKKKMLLYVTIINSNIGSGKYGDPGIPSVKYMASYTKAANKFAEWMKANPNIYVTPCGEGGAQSKMTANDKKFQEYCKAIMPRTQMVNNWGARPSGTDGMRFLCQHPSSIAASYKSLSWIMSDHGLFIRELNVGGALYGSADYNKTFVCAKNLKAKNKTFIYYDFDPNGKVDTEALRAMCDAQK